jgi:valacyclovir hydrolase
MLALLRSLGVGRAHVAGFSDGGEVALVMAAREPAAVRSVVAWGAAGRIVTPPPLVDAFANVVDDPIEPLREFSEHFKAYYGEANARAMARSVAAAWRGIAKAGGDISRGSAGMIASPTLLITGETDPFAPPDVVAELSAAIPRSEWAEVKGAGHVLHDDHGEWLAAKVLEWCARHDS